MITGEWDGFSADVTDWKYTGLTGEIKRKGMVDQLGWFNFLVSGILNAKVKCKETDGCGKITREWTVEGSVSVSNLPFKVAYSEPVIPLYGMDYIIMADKILRVGQYMYEWRQMIEQAGMALLNSPTNICKGSSFTK
jgi:hypothetical protein